MVPRFAAPILSSIHGPHQRRHDAWRLAVWAIALGSAVHCADPPESGSLVLYVDRVALRPGLEEIHLRVARVDLFYEGKGAAPPIVEDETRCDPPNRTTVSAQPVPASIPMNARGRVFLGAFNAPVGKVTEIRLLLSSGSALFRGKVVEVETETQCEDDRHTIDNHDTDDDPNDDSGGDLEFDLIRVVPKDGAAFPISKNQATFVSAELNAITHIRVEDDDELEIASTLLGVIVAPDEVSSIVVGEIVVRFKDGTSAATIQSAIAAKGMTILRTWAPSNYFTLRAPDGADLAAILDFYHNLDSVLYVAPNTLVQYFQPDPLFPSQTQWPQVALSQLSDGSPDPSSGWGTTIGTFVPIVAVVDNGVDVTHFTEFIPNLFINEKEIPQRFLDAVGDRNGDGATDFRDFDFNGDGAITFGDLDSLNQVTGLRACPAGNTPPTTRCTPSDLISGAGREDHSGKQCFPPLVAPPASFYGWEDGVDGDCNGFIDDLVGWDFDGNSNFVKLSPNATTALSHGTTVAGIIGAVGRNGISVAGVNWRVRILPVKPKQSAREFGGTQAIFRDSVYAAFQYASMMRADVINASLGCYVTRDGSGVSDCGFQCGEYDVPGDKYDALTRELRSELDDLQLFSRASGTMLAIAAGNCSLNHDRNDVFAWPSAMTGKNVLRVASVGAAGHPNVEQLSEFSDFGISERGVDIAAPGEFFVGFTVGGATTTCPGATFRGVGIGCAGTSFATPMVAGTGALIISADTALKGHPCRVVDRIKSNADRVAAISDKVAFGGRRLNAANAVANVAGETPGRCGPQE